MIRAVGVAFKRVARSYYFDPGELKLYKGHQVVVETAQGMAIGTVKIDEHEVASEDLDAPLKRILRIATDEDQQRETRHREQAVRAMGTCREEIKNHELPMKLVSAEYSFDGNVITFYFTAEGRIDFRALVKDVSRHLRCKVMFYQIGARDHAKVQGGVGVCGLTLCCSTFLTDFKSISMKMAKDQNLFLNPVKFSGVCGKLMCCLEYEHEVYKEGRARLPLIGDEVKTPKGIGRVVDLNIPQERVIVKFTDSEAQIDFPVSECEWEQTIKTACGSTCGGKSGHCGTARKHYRRDEDDDE